MKVQKNNTTILPEFNNIPQLNICLENCIRIRAELQNLYVQVSELSGRKMETFNFVQELDYAIGDYIASLSCVVGDIIIDELSLKYKINPALFQNK